MRERVRVIMYSRPGCHLCEEAERILATVECADLFDLEIINIEQDEELCRQYGEQIPVIFIAGVKAFTYRVDPREFCRKLRQLVAQAR
jgi:glutaredoxin